MYLSHFGLKEKPFQISPDPRFLWLGETHKEALARLKFGIHDNRGFLLLVGDVGTGKTTLINGLLESLDENVLVATIPDPGLEKLDFYNFLLHAFNIDKQFTSKGDFLVHFIHFLHKANADKKRVLIIIDEAQRLDHEMLEEIRQLSNIETQSAKLLNIFLVGQIELNESLLETRNRALLQRITTRYNISPLPSKEVDEYIKFRLKVAGCDNKLFSPGAVRQVIAFSNCYPRLINVICDHALLTGFVRGKKKVDARIVKECADDLSISTEKPEPTPKTGIFQAAFNLLFYPLRRPLISLPIYGLLLMLLAGMAAYVYFPDVLPLPSTSSPMVSEIEKDTNTFSISKTAPVPSTKSSGETIPAATAASETEASASVVIEKPVSSTPEATPANEPAMSSAELETYLNRTFIIRFRMDSNEFSDDAYDLMNRLVHVIKQKPGLKISVNGYTDSLGNYDYNRRLSKFRATVVKSYLIGQGVAPSRISTYGKGPEDPIESNSTREGRAANRRVEIILSE
jgi:general secretion pathway protein A